MKRVIQNIDRAIIYDLKKCAAPAARIAIFIVYFWFGLLKIIGVSPAGPLVQELFTQTIPFVPFLTFYNFFSLFEMAIGITFLVPGWERLAIFLLSVHLATTLLPFILLPHITWQTVLVPTLEGQYIIKNILIVAMAVAIGSNLIPLKNAR